MASETALVSDRMGTTSMDFSGYWYRVHGKVSKLPNFGCVLKTKVVNAMGGGAGN